MSPPQETGKHTAPFREADRVASSGKLCVCLFERTVDCRASGQRASHIKFVDIQSRRTCSRTALVTELNASHAFVIPPCVSERALPRTECREARPTTRPSAQTERRRSANRVIRMPTGVTDTDLSTTLRSVEVAEFRSDRPEIEKGLAAGWAARRRIHTRQRFVQCLKWLKSRTKKRFGFVQKPNAVRDAVEYNSSVSPLLHSGI
jgi:hypothetical protein